MTGRMRCCERIAEKIYGQVLPPTGFLLHCREFGVLSVESEVRTSGVAFGLVAGWRI